jgi:purine-binding chemotaxis protein CheW
MKVVTSALKKKGLEIEELPRLLQERIESLKELIEKYNETIDDYESTEERDKDTEAELDKLEDFIATTDQDIANEIRKFTPANVRNFDRTPEPTYEPTPEPTPDYEPEPQPQPQPQPEPQPEPEKKKDSGLGFLVIGALLLVGTVGVVNIFKKR